MALSRTSITDGSLPLIGGLQYLELLDLGKTSVSDAVMPSRLRLPGLRTLVLYGTRITDMTLDAIAKLPALQMLNDSLNPGITDAGFVSLGHLEHLKSLEIYGTYVTAGAMHSFSVQCPGGGIERNRSWPRS